MAQWIDTGIQGQRAVFRQQLLHTVELQRWNWHPVLVVHKPIQERTKRRLHRCILGANHRGADHLWSEAIRPDGPNQADGVLKV